MPTTNNPLRPLTELLAELEAAVRAGNRTRAIQLEQTITRRLVQESAERDAVERSLRDLMQRLATASPHVALVPPFEIKGIVTRGGEAQAICFAKACRAVEKTRLATRFPLPIRSFSPPPPADRRRWPDS